MVNLIISRIMYEGKMLQDGFLFWPKKRYDNEGAGNEPENRKYLSLDNLE